jgi:hypothetical protein
MADGLVGVQQLFACIGFVDKEATGHMLADLLDDRKALIVKDKLLAEHGHSPNCLQLRPP